ncbi:hypothetical protein B0H13DRAFT_2192607, partial [Mycena leptocephala]
MTIPVPEGTSNHGDPSLLCTPTRWTNILAFFLGNYIAHAATVVSIPGEQFVDYVYIMVMALLFPTAGIVRGLDAIFRGAVFAQNDLMCAARAGALCMLIRTDHDNDEAKLSTEYLPWNPPRGSSFWGELIGTPCRLRNIHGVEKALPSGYDFAVVPHDAVVLSGHPPLASPRTRRVVAILQTCYGAFTSCRTRGDQIAAQAAAPGPGAVVISASKNAARAVVAILQTFYGIFTLYRARGDQIARYGYAAFGLTVAPYTMMSIINLLGSVLTPSYPTMYLVRSEVMDEVD